MSRFLWDKANVIRFCEDNKCKFTSEEFTNSKVKYSFICECGNTFSKRLDNFLKVPRCFDCGHRRGRGIKEHIEILKEINSSRLDYGVIYQRGDISGREVKVDLGDVDFLLSGALWSINANGYASRHSYETNHKELMHRVILGVTESKIHVDHINVDKLDNRRENLRIATVSQNLANSRSHKNHATPYKGVTITPQGKFRARIGYQNDRIFIGDFNTGEEAAEAYNNKAIELFGKYSHLNKL